MADDNEPFDGAAEIARVRDEVMAAPTPGQDPDTLRRAAKVRMAAAASGGGDDPDSARRAEKHAMAAGLAAEPDDDDVKAKRAAAPGKVQGRSATPPGKAKAAEGN
jgi:hypothetical protein